MQQGRPQRLRELQFPGCLGPSGYHRSLRVRDITNMTMGEVAVRAFWSMHPLRGDAQLSGLDDAFSGDYDAFFTEYARRNRSIASEHGVLHRACWARTHS